MPYVTRAIYFWSTLLVLLLGSSTAFSQDSIRMKTGAVYSVKIIEITETQVKYRTYSNPDGPLYNVSKSTIDQYKLEGKRWEHFYDVPEQRRPIANRTHMTDEELRHNVSINLSDLVRTDLTIFYEIIFENKIGLRIPVTYGFRSAYLNPVPGLGNPFGFQRNTVFKTGIDLRLYAGQGMRKTRFVFGPALYYMRLNRLIPDYATADKDYMMFKTGSSLRFLFLTGLVIRPVPSFQIGFDGGLGFDIDLKEPAKEMYAFGVPMVPKAQLNIHIGYRF